jgi:dipeptidyl aminopeptidase/acylaminoacyl peptidase
MEFTMNFQVLTPRTARTSLLALGLILCFAGGGWADSHQAATKKPHFTPEHIAKIQSASGGTISPNGKRIAYMKFVPVDPKAKGDARSWVQLHVVDQSGRSRAYVAGKTKIGQLQWTPDGKHLSFLSRRGKDKFPSLHAIPLSGGEARRIFSFHSPIRSYDWHPDGKSVAFIATKKEDAAKKKAKTHGFDQQVVEEGLINAHVWLGKVDWSDEGERRANWKAAKSTMLSLNGSAIKVKWSPKGHHLAVIKVPRPLVDDVLMKSRLHIVDTKGKEVGVLNRTGKLGHFEWSPDGKHLAVIAAADVHDPRAGRLLVMDRSGKKVTELLPKLEGHVMALDWADKGKVAYIASVGLNNHIGMVTLSGDDKTLIAGRSGGPIYRSISVSKNGRWATSMADHPQHPTEVYGLDLKKRRAKRLTHLNPWLKDMRWAKQETVTYKARDGLALHGVLIRPLNEKKGTKYPLILGVHGGPESHFSNGWVNRYANPGQMAAARGFAVFYPNYRGSTGRGVAFSKKGQNDYAGGEFNDLVDAVTHFVKTGLADEKRVGVTGGSYGGYASAWAATKLTKHFAASVMFVGITDQVSKFGTTDIPNEMYLVHSRKWPWEDWDYFRDRSPVYHTQKARTPLLILHGKKDPRVHPSQSMILYRYLKTLGKVPVRLVLYPHEGHGNRQASARYDYSLRMLRWMEYYLKGKSKGMSLPPYTVDYGLKTKKAKAADKK